MQAGREAAKLGPEPPILSLTTTSLSQAVFLTRLARHFHELEFVAFAAVKTHNDFRKYGYVQRENQKQSLARKPWIQLDDAPA